MSVDQETFHLTEQTVSCITNTQFRYCHLLLDVDRSTGGKMYGYKGCSSWKVDTSYISNRS